MFEFYLSSIIRYIKVIILLLALLFNNNVV